MLPEVELIVKFNRIAANLSLKFGKFKSLEAKRKLKLLAVATANCNSFLLTRKIMNIGLYMALFGK